MQIEKRITYTVTNAISGNIKIYHINAMPINPPSLRACWRTKQGSYDLFSDVPEGGVLGLDMRERE